MTYRITSQGQPESSHQQEEGVWHAALKSGWHPVGFQAKSRSRIHKYVSYIGGGVNSAAFG